MAWTPPSVGGSVLYLRSLSEIARVDIVRAGAARPPRGPLARIRSRLPWLPSWPSWRPPPIRIPVLDRFLAGQDLPLVNGEEVVFLWRGDAQDVAVAGEMIGIRREEADESPGGDRSLVVVDDPRVPGLASATCSSSTTFPPPTPDTKRRALSTVIGPDMNWNRGEPMEVSWFAMPEWPGRAAGPAEAPAQPGRVETVEVALTPPGEDPEPFNATTRVLVPPGYDDGDHRYPVVFVHDKYAGELGGWVETLDRVVGQTVEPLIVAFVDPPRMPGFLAAFAAELVPAIDARFRTRTDRDGRANVGMGFWSQDAAVATFENPDTFGRLGPPEPLRHR